MSQFDWNGNQGGESRPVAHYRSPGNPNFSSVGGIASWWIPYVLATLIGVPLSGYLIVQALGLFLPTRY